MKVSDGMNEKEMINVLIDKFTDLQRIKKSNGGHVNEELEYQLKATRAKLQTFGVVTEDLEL